MDPDSIYCELGKLVVAFQWLENKLHQIAWIILDPEWNNDPRKQTADFWFKTLVDFVKDLYLKYIDTHEIKNPEDCKRDFLALIDRCLALCHYRNRIVHSTYVHLEAGGELMGILRSKLRSQSGPDGSKHLAFDQELLEKKSFHDAMTEIAEVGFLLGQAHLQLIHWQGRVTLKE